MCGYGESIDYDVHQQEETEDHYSIGELRTENRSWTWYLWKLIINCKFKL